MYQSIILPGEPLYADGYDSGIQAEGYKGFEERNWYEQPYLAAPGTSEFDLPLIPRNEWEDRIAEMERTKTRLSDICEGLPPKNQKQTNYCWVFATTYCAEIVRHKQNQAYVSLSPASAGAKIKNFKNQGGWGSEALEYIVNHGLVPSEQWPDTAIDRQYDTEANDALRSKYRVIEWYELRSRDLDQLFTLLFNHIPASVGYNWWRHQVTAVDPIIHNGTFGVRIRNSWGDWGENGYGILLGNKAIPDDVVGPRTTVPS